MCLYNICGLVIISFISKIVKSQNNFVLQYDKKWRRQLRHLFADKFDYKSMERANPVFAPLIFFTFSVIMGFSLVNFMVSLILEGFTSVQQDLAGTRNESDVSSNHCIHCLLLVLHFFKIINLPIYIFNIELILF